MFLVAAPRKRWIAWSSSANALIPPCSATSSRSSRPWAKLGVLQLVDEHVPVALPQPRAHVRLLAQQPEGLQDEVARVQRARLGQQPVVGREQRRELPLARARPRPRAAPPPTRA